MRTTRKRHSAEFKAKVALEAIRGDLTLAELSAKHGIHHTMIAAWKRQAVEGMSATFSGAGEMAKAATEADLEKAACQDRATCRGAGFFSQSLRSMSVARRRSMIDPAHDRLSISAQCRMLSISRSSFYYAPVPETTETLALMQVIDAAFLDMPWYGSRQMVRHPRRDGHDVGRRRVRRLMSKMGLSPIYQRPRTSDPHPKHRVYPYLLRKLVIDRPNHVWCADITYIPMRHGFLYLVAIMDWATRKVLAWWLSNTMDAGFCVAALEEALARFGKPEIFNTDQGSQFTGFAFTSVLVPRCRSAWTDAGAGWTMSSSSACGAPSNMNAFICTPSRRDRICALALAGGLPITTTSGRTRNWAGRPPPRSPANVSGSMPPDTLPPPQPTIMKEPDSTSDW